MALNALEHSRRPQWLTFDCYGTLIQWDEGLQAAIRKILSAKQSQAIDPARFIGIYDRHEHTLEQTSPHRSFRIVTADALRLTLDELGLQSDADDARVLTDSISAMPQWGVHCAPPSETSINIGICPSASLRHGRFLRNKAAVTASLCRSLA